jgi:hypothetical protein
MAHFSWLVMKRKSDRECKSLAIADRRSSAWITGHPLVIDGGYVDQ